MYRILAGQYLLQNYDDINKDDIYQTLYGFSIDVDLGLGQGQGSILTTDLGHGYIDENRTTS